MKTFFVLSAVLVLLLVSSNVVDAVFKQQKKTETTEKMTLFAETTQLDDELISEACSILIKGNLHNTSADIICNTIPATKADLKFVCQEIAAELKDVASPDFDCEAYVARAADEGNPMWGQIAPAGRVGEEDELVHAAIVAVNEKGLNEFERVGVVRYGQRFAMTKGKAIGFPLIDFTVDGVNPKRYGIAFKNNFAKKKKFPLEELTKDHYSFHGITEIVTAPIFNSDLPFVFTALQTLIKAMKTVATNCNSWFSAPAGWIDLRQMFLGTDYKFSTNYAVPFEVIVKQYNDDVAADANLKAKLGDKYTMTGLEYAQINPDGKEVPKPNYKYYMLCSTDPAHSHFVQANFAIPVRNFVTAKFGLLYESEGGKFAISTAEKVARGIITKAPEFADVRGNEQLIGLFTLFITESMFLAYRSCLLQIHKDHEYPPPTAARLKNLFEFLPKGNLPDIVRLLPSNLQEALLKYYNVQIARNPSQVAQGMIDSMGLTISIITPNILLKFASTFENEANMIRRQKGTRPRLDAYYVEYLKLYLTYGLTEIFKPFYSDACIDRYRGESDKAYGQSIDERKLPSLGCRFYARFLPVGRQGEDVYVVFETRFHNKITAALTVDETIDYFNRKKLPPGLLTLSDIQK